MNMRTGNLDTEEFTRKAEVGTSDEEVKNSSCHI